MSPLTDTTFSNLMEARHVLHSPVAFGLKESQVRKESDFFKVTTNHMYLMSVDPCKAQPWAVLQCLK